MKLYKPLPIQWGEGLLQAHTDPRSKGRKTLHFVALVLAFQGLRWKLRSF